MTNQIRTKADIEKVADRIATDIMSVNTDYRGNLLAMVAEKLAMNAQGYTSKCLRVAAETYGVNHD